MKIRDYRPSDFPAIKRNLEVADMFDEVWDSQANVDALATETPCHVLVAEHEGKVIGSLFIDQFGPEVAFIYRVVVDPDYRKHGTATQLLEAARARLAAKGAQEIALFVDAEKGDLLDFYAKRGYREGKHLYRVMWRPVKEEED